MQEDLKENLILLSKVAKEKKYAQEYLGLLARRGDIGSIRVGKRWYTTWAWFAEFLENGQKKSSADKKEVVSEVPVVVPMQAESVKEILPTIEKEEVKINVPFVFPKREKVLVTQPVASIKREEKVFDGPAAVEASAGKPAKIAIAVKTRKIEVPFRKNTAGDIRKAGGIMDRGVVKMQSAKNQIRNSVPEARSPLPAGPPREAAFINISVEKRNRHAVPYREVKLRKKTGVFSPDFSGEGGAPAPVFGRLAFAFGFAAAILLVAASGYFVYSGGLLAKGKVAGASDERNAGLSGIKSESEYFLASTTDKTKEAMSISRVIVEAAKEREYQANSGN